MAYPNDPTTLWILAALHMTGIVSAWIARLSEGSRSQALCHFAFFALLGMVAFATMASVISMCPMVWLGSTSSLSLMILGAVWDFRSAARPEHFI